MLTRHETEICKVVATRKRIDFAPLTLLFGGNAAGRSATLLGLLCLLDLLKCGSADVDRTELGGRSQASRVIYKAAEGRLSEQPLYRDDEPTLELSAPTRCWSFDGDGHLLRLVRVPKGDSERVRRMVGECVRSIGCDSSEFS